ADFIFLMIWFLYRLIHHYLLSKQRIDILIKIIDANHNPFTKTMTLYDKKGKKALKRQQKVVRLLPDPTGYYKIEDIPKGLYCLKTDDGSLNLLVGQNKLKNQTLLIKSFKRTKVSFTRITENEIQLLDVTFNKA
ncbi:MAG: class C sortase, partial [Pseudolactococcus laudensis]